MSLQKPWKITWIRQNVSKEYLYCMFALLYSWVLSNKEPKKATICASRKLPGQILWKMCPLAPRPPLQTMCARLSAKTPASLDLQISPEIEESAGREILKRSGACFLPSPDSTSPIWVFSSDLFSVCVFLCALPRLSRLHTLFKEFFPQFQMWTYLLFITSVWDTKASLEPQGYLRLPPWSVSFFDPKLAYTSLRVYQRVRQVWNTYNKN